MILQQGVAEIGVQQSPAQKQSQAGSLKLDLQEMNVRKSQQLLQIRPDRTIQEESEENQFSFINGSVRNVVSPN